MESLTQPLTPKTRFIFKPNHDLVLLEQVQKYNPFAAPKSKAAWYQIAHYLRKLPLGMKVNGRNCLGRTRLLMAKMAQFHGVDEAIISAEWLSDPNSTVLVDKLREWQSVRKPSQTIDPRFQLLPLQQPYQVIVTVKTDDGAHATHTGDHFSNSSFAAASLNADADASDAADPLGDHEHVTTPTQSQDLHELASRLVIIESKVERLVQWTKHQDDVNQEILNQLKHLRTRTQTQTVPNPCVRLARWSPSETNWRKTRTTRRPPPLPPPPESGQARRKDTTNTTNTNPNDVNGSLILSPASPSSLSDEIVKVESDDLNFEMEPEALLDDLETQTPAPPTTNRLDSDDDFNDPWKPRILRRAKPKPKVCVPKPCDRCPEIFNTLIELKAHQRKTHDDRPHICPTCGKAFRQAGTLETHERTHSSERPFKCKYCDSSFRSGQGLYIHERLHLLGTKKYPRSQCALCGQLFTTDFGRRKHIQLVHENVRAFDCHLCDKKFKTKFHLKYHLGTHEKPGGRQRGLNREPGAGEGECSSVVRIKRIGGVSRVKAVNDPNGVARSPRNDNSRRRRQPGEETFENQRTETMTKRKTDMTTSQFVKSAQSASMADSLIS